MSEMRRTRVRQAELSPAQRRELDRLQAAIAGAKEAFALGAGRIAIELGRGGNAAVARHLQVSPQHVSTLAIAYRTGHPDESAAPVDGQDEGVAA
ncbi:hypothetical protein ACWGHM_42285 [Streptomyces sp. NPDC054904]